MRIQGTTSVGANASSGNVLAGKTLELMPFHGAVRVYAVAAAAGIKGTFYSGTDIVMEESDMSAANRFPVTPDDLTATDIAAQGERLNLTFRNTTAGAVNVSWIVDVQPV